MNFGVSNFNNAFEGGTLARASAPTAVGGGFNSFGSSDVSGGKIAKARNNRGSNIRIPYARLVPRRPLKRRDDAVYRHDQDLHRHEAADLSTGKLAWIFCGKDQATKHRAGFGVDRCQRLITTNVLNNEYLTPTPLPTGTPLADVTLQDFPDSQIHAWVPDGIVLGKLETDQEERHNAHYDSQMGQLYNIGVQGPCITVDFTNHPSFKTSPLDRLFVLLVAKKTEANKVKLEYRPYTSTYMFMTKKYGLDENEKLLGGYCLGKVLDSAASRAVTHANHVRRSNVTMTCNLNVSIEWWTADSITAAY